MFRIVVSVSLFVITAAAARPLLAQRRDGGGPSLAFIEASGCEGLFLYAWNEGRSEVLTIRVDRHSVKLVDGTTTLNLAAAGEGVAVHVEVTRGRRETMPYCSEAGAGQSSDEPPAIWTARAGSLKIVFRRRGAGAVTPVSVTLDDLVLASPEGAESRSKRTIRFTAAVFDLAP
jgi:hypothetical protein